MPSMPWIKLYTEMLDDPKLGRLHADLKWHFVALCLLAGECDAEGYLVNGMEAYTIHDIAWRLREPPAAIGASLEILQNAGLVCRDEDDTWFVTSFAKRQGRSQSEKRAQWRERKRRQREREDDATVTTEPVPANVPRDIGGNHAGFTPLEKRREEGDIEGEEDQDVSPSGETPAASPPKTASKLTEGQRGFLSRHGAKRFKNSTQAAAILALEQTYGTRTLLEGSDWTAKKGMTLGNAITSLETALPKWGQARASPGNNGPEPKGYAGIRQWMEEDGIQWQDVKQSQK